MKGRRQRHRHRSAGYRFPLNWFLLFVFISRTCDARWQQSSWLPGWLADCLVGSVGRSVACWLAGLRISAAAAVAVAAASAATPWWWKTGRQSGRRASGR